MGFYVQVREVMYEEYDKLFAGKQGAETALANIEDGANKLLAKFAVPTTNPLYHTGPILGPVLKRQ